MKHARALLAVVLLAACQAKPDLVQKEREDDRDIAMVEAAQSQHPPPQSIELEPMSAADISDYQIHAAGCSLYTAEGAARAPVLLLDSNRAYLKIGGRMQSLAADPGSARLTLGYATRYSGKRFVIDVTVPSDAGERVGEEIIRRATTVTVRDPWDQIIYKRDVALECGA